MKSEDSVKIISNILVSKLNYAYCDNCGRLDDECDDCHRKYQNWCLSEATAEYLANEILLALHREGVVNG